MSSRRRRDARHAWPLIRAFWVSEQRWRAWGLLAVVVALDLLIIYRAAHLTYWQKSFYDMLSARAAAAFWPLLGQLGGLALLAVLMDTARTYVAQALEMRWRTWLTGHTLTRWLGDYRLLDMEREHRIDNADQRMTEDVKWLTSMLPNLGLGLLSNVVSFCTFAAIVWQLSAAVSLAWGTGALQVPGLMLWAAVLYALIGSAVMEAVAGRLVRIDYDQQKAEAGFRHLLMQQREQAEQLALHGGAQAEQARAIRSFDRIRANWRLLMAYTKRVTATDRLYLEGGSLVAYGLAGPAYLAGRMTLGDLMQLTQAFMKVRAALSWFVFRYKDIALLRSVCQRLAEFDAALAAERPTGLVRACATEDLSLHAVVLLHPDGRQLAPALDLRIAPGQRWLLRGPSGVGKSTLLKAMAGVWPYAQGCIRWPEGKQAMFLPQLSYLPPGSLWACVSYPCLPGRFAREEVRQALVLACLEELQDELDTEADWAKRLSVGQQQRLAWARVFLQRPDLLFLDEASSALDVATEARLHAHLLSALPTLTLVSVAHRDTVVGYHTHVLALPSAAS